MTLTVLACVAVGGRFVQGCGEIDMSYEEMTTTAERELAAEAEESDVAVILREALARAERADKAKRSDILAAAMKQADEARSFEPVLESPLPEGWPAPSLPGLIRIKRYPASRTAWSEGQPSQNKRFMGLLKHINVEQIAMTAPVMMDYPVEAALDPETMPDSAAMAFLYRHDAQGEIGRFGEIDVRNEPPVQVVSVGVKGLYSTGRFRRAMTHLDGWLAERPEWRIAGRPRVLAYNSPFVLPWKKYAEVQIPVEWVE